MTKTKKSTRIISIFLVFIFSLSLAMSASALTSTNKQTSTVKVLTYAEKILGETSKVKIKNTGSIPFTITKSSTNCSIKIYSGGNSYSRNAKTVTLYPGDVITYTISTSFCKTGTANFKISTCYSGYNCSYSATGSNYLVMSRV